MSNTARDVGRDSGDKPGGDKPGPDASGEGGSQASGPSAAGAPKSRGGKSQGKKANKQLPLWQEMGLLLGIALVLAIVIKAFLMQAFYIPSGSMRDTLVKNDRILVQKISYWGDGEPQRGDIVVFSDPGGWLDQSEVRSANNPVTRALELFGLYPTGGHLVKRVIGVGGDTVKCCDKQGRMLVNGVPLNERSYLAEGEKPSLIKFEVDVREGSLWVQGDNRSNSADSRVHLGDPGGGLVPTPLVVGKVFTVVWPWDHAKLVDRPATFDSVSAE